MRRRQIARLAVVALLVAACNGDATSTTQSPSNGTTLAEETTTTASETTTTAAETTTPEESPAEDEATHIAYLTGYVVTPPDQAELARRVLEEEGFVILDASLEEVLGSIEEVVEGADDPDGTSAEELIAARDSLAEILQVFEVQGEEDLLETVQRVRAANQDLLFSPIIALGAVGHSGFRPGTNPSPIGGSIDPPPDADPDANLAAVVDSGVHPSVVMLDNPETEGDSIEWRGIDREPDGQVHSHGTFVAGLIRQLAPDHRITLARARFRPMAEFSWSDGAVGDTDLQGLTTELEVAEAILRLVSRHERHPERVKGLNLSLGGHSLTQDRWAISIDLALSIWSETFPEATVYAAGGNSLSAHPFWPAALPSVTGVGAANDGGEEIVWDDNQNEVTWSSLSSPARTWVTELAPGSQLAQYSQPGQLVCWSGSSFATAVASGYALNNGQTPGALPRIDLGLTFCEEGALKGETANP